VDVPLRLGTRTLAVKLASEGDGFSATLDGAVHRVVVLGGGPRSTAGGASVEELALEIDGRPCRPLVARLHDRLLVSLGGRVYTFESGDEAPGAESAGGSGAVTAPMPGKVVSVLVAVGDVVTSGQPLVVLEAMKMESTLTAEIDGRVSEVPVVAGATVAAGDVLVTIEPA